MHRIIKYRVNIELLLIQQLHLFQHALKHNFNGLVAALFDNSIVEAPANRMALYMPWERDVTETLMISATIFCYHPG